MSISGHTHSGPLMYGNVRLYAGSSSPDLALDISEFLDVPLCDRDIVTYPNDNIFIKLHKSVRGQDCYVIQTTSIPVHHNLMELLIMIQTLRLDSAARITAVVPYLCYTRSDKKDQPRVPITARLVADMIEVAGADRYMTFDLHADQIQGFFSIPGDVLYASHVLIPYMEDLKKTMRKPVMVSPGSGFCQESAQLRNKTGSPLGVY
jgi:ribose-phosphate pyrophosphokinase